MKWLLVSFAVVGCAQSASVICDDGRTCPIGTECQTLTTALGTQRPLCVTADERAACAGKADGDACDLPGTTGGGACHDGACVFAECGNGLVDPDEVCDDENGANDDSCSQDCRSTLTCGNGVFDASIGEECDPGDALGHDGCASSCKLESARWVALASERPSARDFAALAYDRIRRRIVLFGGATHVEGQLFPLDDTSEWDGTRWRTAPSAVAPSNRYAHAMAYDAARDQLVVFSGVNNQADTWVTVDGVWQQRMPAHSPPSRDYGQMAYDAARKQIVLFGGFSTDTQEVLGDSWTWDGTDWHEIVSATKPSPRLGHAMAYDPGRGVTVLFGGGDTDFSAEVWEFDGTTWANRTPTVPGPSPRMFAAMAYDPSTGEILVTGGRTDPSDTYDDAFSWNGSRWVARASLPSTTDDVFVAHAMATDPVRGRVVVLGTNGTLYEWSSPAWTIPAGGRASPPPVARQGAAIVLDPLRDEIVMFGGTTDALTRLDETWIWIGEWIQATPSVTPPERTRAAIAYDERRGEVVMYGGCAVGDGLADTWVWRGGDPGAWILKSASSPPGKRCEATMAFDAKRGKVVLVAGHDGGATPTYSTTTWTWDGIAWTLEPSTATPSPRAAPASAYDRVRERVVLFGGARPPGVTRLDFTDTWTWDGSTWSQLSPSTVPPARTRATLAWDPARARAVLVGGLSTEGNYAYADAYEWDGTNWNAITSDYPARQDHAMTTAPGGAGVLMFGGNARSPNAPTQLRLADTLRLRWDANVGYEACTDLDGDGDARVGCADPDCWWTCTPTCPPATSCVADAPRCGDAQCNAAIETCFTCPMDCGECPSRCGDFVCSADETSCPGDCTP